MQLPFILANRFVAAETLEETLPVVRELNDKGLYLALDLLGEYVKDRNVAAAARDTYIHLVHTLAGERQHGAHAANISIKLSMMGQKIDEGFCLDNLRQLLAAAKERNVFIRLDMEGTDITDSTVRLFEQVYPDYPDHVGIVLQAYLKRTEGDVRRMCDLKARVRMCKGAYKEPPELAYQDMPTIRERFMAYTEMLLTDGRYPGIATHDDLLIDATKRLVAKHQIDHDDFEFQMLYGIRPTTQEETVAEGYNMRVYVPYGTEWFPYFSRRLRERKENVWFVVSNLFRR
ncbi:MAG: proline dehydrogenase family protein [Bacteroidota bacterium]